ncbi:MAG: hypothetical protein H9777_00675 [Candidatus Phocaeicola faecigallinarum]|uniref:Uncharacterized protein n=1 Tax=Candidatus Phocaeicola faecigallinarum TaxID=2838732 RepID=A0A948WVQ4_9BACT|nr:hypothetical protein [uncultured Bacteroides sp.]MBU3836849.1 hypothetical protein [Candidatus Phocaeicola faecigallinarum]
MEQINTDIVNIQYQQTGASSAVNALGVSEITLMILISKIENREIDKKLIWK